ncbi:DUF2690 domain-containing protein [Streptomyces sp. DW26H14]|uniref:DUF2690 domain-containing protein n=1 Tax=Streptomyces sp. DW26H14 TaxID=3435395 RepID=UPI00403D60D2
MARRGTDPAGELADRMRELIDRSGLSLDAIAIRTGRGREEWEAYVRGLRRPPREVTSALAEAVGTHEAPLLELWDRAELRARSEGTDPDAYPTIFLTGGALDSLSDQDESPGEQEELDGSRDQDEPDARYGPGPDTPHDDGAAGAGPDDDADRFGGPPPPRHLGDFTDFSGSSDFGDFSGEGRPGPGQRPGRAKTLVLVSTAVGVALVVLAVVLLTGLGDTGSGGARTDAGRTAAGRTDAGTAPGGAASPTSAGTALGGESATGPGPGGTPGSGASGSAPPPVSGSAGASGPATGPASPQAPGASASASLPPGVRCAPGACAGLDPEAMGCASGHATTLATGTVGGAFVEVRYSAVCAAAWGRVTGAAASGSLLITPGGGPVAADAGGPSGSYTPMVAAPEPHALRACFTLSTGAEGCATAR